MVKNLVRAFGLAAVLGLAAGPAVAASASAPALAASSQPVAVAAPVAQQVVTVTAHTAHSAHGTLSIRTYSKRAGTCAIWADWSATYGSQNSGVQSKVWVKAYIDSCSGGGTLQYQSEMVCDTDGGQRFYYYGPWSGGISQGSTVTQGNNCWEAVGTANGAPVVAALRENRNSPTRIDCDSSLTFYNGRTVSGSGCGTHT